nr:hypothetical protein [Orientia tsutsugamushi]
MHLSFGITLIIKSAGTHSSVFLNLIATILPELVIILWLNVFIALSRNNISF